MVPDGMLRPPIMQPSADRLQALLPGIVYSCARTKRVRRCTHSGAGSLPGNLNLSSTSLLHSAVSRQDGRAPARTVPVPSPYPLLATSLLSTSKPLPLGDASRSDGVLSAAESFQNPGINLGLGEDRVRTVSGPASCARHFCLCMGWLVVLQDFMVTGVLLSPCVRLRTEVSCSQGKGTTGMAQAKLVGQVAARKGQGGRLGCQDDSGRNTWGPSGGYRSPGATTLCQ